MLEKAIAISNSEIFKNERIADRLIKRWRSQINLKWILYKLKIYIRLTRLNQPIGIFLLLWPTLWALCVSNEGQIRLDRFLVFVIGVITMRSAGCVINDYFDRNIDGKIERTKNRPLPSGRNFPNRSYFLVYIINCSKFLSTCFPKPKNILVRYIYFTFRSILPFDETANFSPTTAPCFYLQLGHTDGLLIK